MFPPQFVVTFLGVVEKRDISRYSTNAVKTDIWKVGMTHAQVAGETINLYFPTESQARTFSQWGVYTQQDILKRVGDTQSKFSVKDIAKTKTQGPPNRYTDRPTIIESWKAALENMTDGRQIEWAFPTEKEAREKFSPSNTYSFQGMFGTMPSQPVTVTEAYIAAAEAAVDRAKEKEQAEYDLQIKKAKKESAVSASQAAIAKQEAANIKKAQARTSGLRSQAASLRGQATKKLNLYNQTGNPDYLVESARLNEQASLVESQAQTSEGDIGIYQSRYNAAKSASAAADSRAKALAKAAASRTIPEGISEWTIAEGGAAGYYNGVYYKEGQFTVKNGPWVGTYKERL